MVGAGTGLILHVVDAAVLLHHVEAAIEGGDHQIVVGLAEGGQGAVVALDGLGLHRGHLLKTSLADSCRDRWRLACGWCRPPRSRGRSPRPAPCPHPRRAGRRRSRSTSPWGTIRRG